MGLLERIAAERSAPRGQPPALRPADVAERASSIDWYIANVLIPANDPLTGQALGLRQTWTPGQTREIANTLPGYSQALKSCPPAFAAQLVRSQVLSQARFTFRNPPYSQTPRKTFGTSALGLLERPWPNATTGQMIARLEWHAGLTGNAYVTRQPGPRLRVLRPDWTAILFGSQREPDDPVWAIDAEVIGYVYQNGGIVADGRHKPVTLLPQDVAHWSPLPDPESPEIGMSWITPAVRDIQADRATTEHKLTFFRQGATPNLVIKGIPATTKAAFDEIVDAMEQKHSGLANAYRTLYLTAGADATVVGSNLRDLDLRSSQGGGETRIAFLSRVPAPILQIAEGLAGSALNVGNFGMARRLWGDSWIYPTLQDLARALAPLIDVPPDAELWTDTGDMPILREDARDAAEIELVKTQDIVTLVKEGFTPESAVAAVMGQNKSLLKHTGLVSVQLQPPGSVLPGTQPQQPALPAPAAPGKNGQPGQQPPGQQKPKPKP